MWHTMQRLNENDMQELQQAFSDLLNYDSDDPTEPIDPLNYRDSGGDSCIHIAALRGNSHAVELLLKAGINVDDIGEMGCTALHHASRKGYEDIIRLLLDNGASTDIENDFGKLPLEK